MGGRIWGKIGDTSLDFEVEGAGQFGTVGPRRHRGRDVHGRPRLHAAGPALSPRVYLEFDYASGDSSPGGTSARSISSTRTPTRSSGTSTTSGGRTSSVPARRHRQPGPRPHAVAPAVLLLARLRSRRHLQQGGGRAPAGTGTTARYVGAEIDLLATYNFTRHLQGYAGYSHFFTGEFIGRRARTRTATSSTWRSSTRSGVLDRRHRFSAAMPPAAAMSACGPPPPVESAAPARTTAAVKAHRPRSRLCPAPVHAAESLLAELPGLMRLLVLSGRRSHALPGAGAVVLKPLATFSSIDLAITPSVRIDSGSPDPRAPDVTDTRPSGDNGAAAPVMEDVHMTDAVMPEVMMAEPEAKPNSNPAKSSIPKPRSNGLRPT